MKNIKEQLDIKTIKHGKAPIFEALPYQCYGLQYYKNYIYMICICETEDYIEELQRENMLSFFNIKDDEIAFKMKVRKANQKEHRIFLGTEYNNKRYKILRKDYKKATAILLVECD